MCLMFRPEMSGCVLNTFNSSLACIIKQRGEKLRTRNWQCLLPHQASLGLPGKITFNGIIIPDSKDITLLFLSVWLAFIAALYAELENDIAMVSVLVVELVDASRYNQLGLLFTPLNQPGVRLLLSLHCYQCYLCGLAGLSWPSLYLHYPRWSQILRTKLQSNKAGFVNIVKHDL